MKANELMLGDWVLLDRNYPTLRKSPVKITWDDLDRIRYGRECEPIPLTAEILEKNGWTWDNTRGEYVSSAIILEWNDDTCEAWLHIGGEYIIIHYVHELQHALRLCGLNELADNFKI